MKKVNKILSVILMVVFVITSFAACGGNTETKAVDTTVADTAAVEKTAVDTEAAETKNSASTEKVSFKFFSNNPNRQAGQGLAEQKLIDDYMKVNPNVTIEVETIGPDDAYMDKLRIYNASSSLPDVMLTFAAQSVLQPLLKANSLAEISTDAIKDYGFIPAAIDVFTIDGKLYALPKNSDFYFLYYNKQLFKDNNIEVPKTEADLLKAIKTFKAKNIIPIAMDGKDDWPTGIWFDTMLQRASGTWDTKNKAVDRSGSFNDPAVTLAATAMQNWVNAGAFGKGLFSTDYGAARNMFGQGKAAMYMMGSWEMGLSSDSSFPEEIRKNMGAFDFPALTGGKGAQGDLNAWFGGSYAVANNNKKEHAMEFLLWFMKPENWTKVVWENSICVPAQTFDKFMTGNESGLQKDITAVFNTAKSYGGTLIQDQITADARAIFMATLQKIEGNKIKPEAVGAILDEMAEKSAKDSAN